MGYPSAAARGALVVVSFWMLTFGVSLASAQKLLRWRLQPGETIDVRLAQKMDTEASIEGTVLKSSVEMLMAMKWHVLGVDPQGTAEMTQSIDRMKMTMQSPGLESVTYDSASAEPPTGVAKGVAAGIRPLLGVKFIQKMNDRGEIVDVRLSKEAAEALDMVPSGAELKEMFSQQGMKALVNQATAVLPEGPVRPGDTWQGQSDTKSPAGDLKMDIQYTYHGTQQRNGRPLERIGVDLHLSFPEEANPLGLSVKVKDQQNAGVLYFDAAEGRFVETQLRQKMVLETALGERAHQQVLDMNLRMQFVSDRTAARRASSAPRTAVATPRVPPRRPVPR